MFIWSFKNTNIAQTLPKAELERSVTNQDGKRFKSHKVKRSYRPVFLLEWILIMINKPKFFLFAVVLIFGLFFFLNTNPGEVPIYVLIIPFVYFFVLTYLATSVGQDLLRKKVSSTIPLIFSCLMLLMLVLGSLHQLGAKDIILSLVLMVLLGWYILKIQNQ